MCGLFCRQCNPARSGLGAIIVLPTQDLAAQVLCPRTDSKSSQARRHHVFDVSLHCMNTASYAQDMASIFSSTCSQPRLHTAVHC